jgi:hypothetical protein
MIPISFRHLSDPADFTPTSLHVNNRLVSTHFYAFHTEIAFFGINFRKFVFFINGIHRADVPALAAPFAAENHNIPVLL